MLKYFKFKFKNRNEIFALSLLIIITISFTSYYNFTKKKINNNYKEIINNIYFKKTANHFLNNLEPKFKKIRHQIAIGETFDSILNQYSVNKKQIQKIKNKLSEKIDLNKLNTNQKIYLIIDQSNNSVKEFILQISNKERVLLTRSNEEKNDFSQEIILTKLDKKREDRTGEKNTYVKLHEKKVTKSVENYRKDDLTKKINEARKSDDEISLMKKALKDFDKIHPEYRRLKRKRDKKE